MTSAELASIQAPQEPAADLQAPWSRGLHIAVPAATSWLRRALAESARAWALAAGVPPDLYPPYRPASSVAMCAAARSAPPRGTFR
jgi:hypothetical protein